MSPSVMKNVVSIAVIVAFTSALFIGCGFVDDNPSAATFDDPDKIEITYDADFEAKLDTMGYED